MYSISRDFILQNRSNIPLKAVGLVIHETASPGATAAAERSYFNNAYRGASAHVFCDWTSIVQTIPWDEKAWHACEPANSMFIGVELCHATTDAQFAEVWKRGVWLFAYLFMNVLKIHTVNKDNLMSHDEVSKKWHNTTHTDPVAYFAEYGKTVDDFRAAVQVEINKTIEGEEGMLITIPFGVADEGAARVLAANKKGAVLDWGLVYPEDDVIQVGGPADSKPQNPCKSFKVISGASRLETAEAVCKFIREGR